MPEINQRKILYIEDDPDSRVMMADILDLNGFAFIGASRGLEGIRMATNDSPSLILLDINLPDMDGYEVTTLLRSIKALDSVPIIAISVETNDQSRERILSAGCDGFISKPINIKEFLGMIDEYLTGRKDLIAPEDEKKYLTEYNIRLGERLQNKIEEMEKINKNLISMNEELGQSQRQLTEYNNRLYAMNNIANILRLQSSPQAVLEILPDNIIEGFGIDRCLIFEYLEEKDRLEIVHASGISELNIKKLKFLKIWQTQSRKVHSFY